MSLFTVEFYHRRAERADGEDELCDGPSADQMFLNDALEDFGRRGVIPDTIWVDDGYGALLADAQAVGFGAVDAVFALHETGFSEAFFEILPGNVGDLARGAFGGGLVGAEEDVARELADGEAAGFLGQALDVFVVHVLTSGAA